MIATRHVEGRPRLALDEAGDGPLLLFLHGVGGRRGNWRRQVEHFGRRCHAVAVDARGYGDSGDVDGPRAFTDFADDVVRVMDALGADRAHLCGLSMGGRIALDCWRRHPGRVTALTLADTSAGSKETQDPARVEAFLAARRRPLLEGRTPAELAPELAGQIVGPNASEAARAEIVGSLAALRTESYLRTLEAVTRFTDFPDFAAIDVPVQVIVGAEDRVAPPHIAEAMAAAIPGARLDVIPDAGHIANVEAPDAFNAALDAFLDEVAR